jgi:hypothetical protein
MMVLPALAPRLGDHRVLLAPLLVERVESGLCLLGVDGTVDRPEPGSYALAVLVGNEPHRAADLVNDACLYPRWGEHRGDRLGEPGEPVDATDEDVLHTTVVQVVQHREPELRALSVLPADPEDLARPRVSHRSRGSKRGCGLSGPRGP